MSFDRVRWIELPKVADKRGNLSFIESARHIPFEIARNMVSALQVRRVG